MSEEIKLEQLKDCPFCGSDSAYRSTDDLWTRHRFRITCNMCEASTGGCVSHELAVKDWNTRVGTKC